MTAADGFYHKVIDEVIDRMRRVFVEEGQSEDILERLKDEWQHNLYQISNDAQ